MRNSQFAVSFTRRPKKLALIILLAMSGHSAPLYASDEELYLFSQMASENSRPTIASPAPRAVPRTRAVANPAVAPVRTQPARQPATSFARVPQPAAVIPPPAVKATVPPQPQPFGRASAPVARTGGERALSGTTTAPHLLPRRKTASSNNAGYLTRSAPAATRGGFLQQENNNEEVIIFRKVEPQSTKTLPTTGQQSVTPYRREPTLTDYAALPATLPTPGRTVAGPSEAQLQQIFMRAVRQAWSINPQLMAVKAQSSMAEANVDEAKGQRWPQLDVNAQSPSLQFGDGQRSKQSSMPAFGINMATNLYDFGQTASTIASRQETLTASQQAIIAQQEDVALQVSNALITLTKERQVIELSKSYVARMNELTTMLSGIVKADQGRRSELTQARSRLLQAQSLLDSAVSRARDAEITLHRLLGETQVPLPQTPRWNLQPANLARLLQRLEDHPAIQRAQAEARAAQKEIDAVKASAMPKLNWTVSKSTQEDQLGNQQAWQTGLNVSWPLFRGGSNRASERAAVQRAETSLQQMREMRLEYENRIRKADQDAHAMLDRAELYSNLTVESDRIRLDFFDQWYHLGRRTLLDVLGAETDYHNNRISEVSNRYDGYAAIFRGNASAGQLIPWLAGSSI